jgi:hypothetical protein
MWFEKHLYIFGALLFLISFAGSEAFGKSAVVDFCKFSESSIARDSYDKQIASVSSVSQLKRLPLEKIGFTCKGAHSSLRFDKNKNGFSCTIKCACSRFGKSKDILIGINANVAGGDSEFNFSKLNKQDSVFILSGFSKCK